MTAVAHELSASQLLTADQLARRWQVPKSHVYRLTREGAIPAVKLGRYYETVPAPESSHLWRYDGKRGSAWYAKAS